MHELESDISGVESLTNLTQQVDFRLLYTHAHNLDIYQWSGTQVPQIEMSSFGNALNHPFNALLDKWHFLELNSTEDSYHVFR